MAAGLRVRNNASSLVIDENFFNFALISKQTLQFNGGTAGPVSGGYGNQAKVTISGLDTPLVAARASVPWTVSRRIRNSNGDWEFGFISAHGAGATPSDTIEIFVFDRPKLLTSGGAGLIVRDASGKPTFDSRQKYMRVVDATTLTGASPAGTITLPAGDYAQLVTVPAFRWMGTQASPSAPWQWACSASLITSSATGCTVASQNTGEGTYASFGNPAPVASSTQMQIITVNVAGY